MSYREMLPLEAAVLMAFDMHQCVPTFSPSGVAAFLRETTIRLPTIDQEQKRGIRELVEGTRDASILADFRGAAGELVSAPAGRGSILGLVGHPDVAVQMDDRQFRDRVGVEPETELTLPEWSVWTFRELQAARAIVEASAPRRRASPEAHSEEIGRDGGMSPRGMLARRRVQSGATWTFRSVRP